MLVDGMEYTSVKLVATDNQQSELFIGKLSNTSLWRFIVKFKDQDSFITGLPFTTKTEILQNVIDHVNLADLSVEHVLVKSITLTEDQCVAINTAIMLISQSESDHAEQCLFYLNQIKELMH